MSKYKFENYDDYKALVTLIRNADDQTALNEVVQFASEIHSSGYWNAAKDASEKFATILNYAEDCTISFLNHSDDADNEPPF